jgi:NTP pyrophosphatase (non-canonical NTP hydrolase)
MKIPLFTKVRKWGRDRQINDAKAQFCHIVEELGETATELNRNRLNSKAMEDSVGDVMVCIIVFADIIGLDAEDCLALAYREIKNRDGKIINGNFVKSSDL